MAARFATTAGVPRDNRAAIRGPHEIAPAISWGGDNEASRRLGRAGGNHTSLAGH